MMKKIAVALVAAGGLLVAAAPAHAGGHVSLSLGVGLPGIGYAAPAYYGPPPAVYTPAPVYAPSYAPSYAPVYVPAPYYGPRYYGPRYYGPRYYGPRYDGPRVVFRGGPHYHGYR